MDGPKDDQNWQPGDTAEAIQNVGDFVTKRVAMPKGSRFVVAGVTIAWCRRRCGDVIALRFVGWPADAWTEASCFRKIIPTFEEPKVVDMVTL